MAEFNQSSIQRHLIFNSQYRVLICRPCQYAVHPGGLKQHLRRDHKEYSGQLRKQLSQYSESLTLDSTAEIKAIQPNATVTPIDGLKIVRGYQCKHCNTCYGTLGTIQHHIINQHQLSGRANNNWEECDLQSFFKPINERKYFRVNKVSEAADPASDNNGVDPLVQKLQECAEKVDLNAVQTGTIVPPESLHIDKSVPWLRRTGWLHDFAGKDMKVIAEKARKPGMEEKELLMVWKSVVRTINKCIAGARDCARVRRWDSIMFWLESSTASDPSRQPFKYDLDPDTLERYAGWFGRFICYCLRIVRDDDEELVGVEFLHRHRVALQRALDFIEETVNEDELDEDELDDMIFSICAMFIVHPPYSGTVSALVHFLQVLGYDERTSTWREPGTYTPILAAFKFCIRVLGLKSAIPTGGRDALIASGGNPMIIFRGFHCKWLVAGLDTPYNMMYTLMQYGKAAAQNSISVGRLLWINDGQTMVFDGRPIQLRDYIKMIHRVHVEAKNLLTECLFGNMESFNLLDLRDLTDDINNTTKGFSFIRLPRNKLLGGCQRMIAILKTNSEEMQKLVTLLNGELVFNPQGSAEYMKKIKKFLAKLLFLVHLTAGQPARGPEITSIRHFNSATSRRNIYIHNGQIMIVTAYHKSQAITDHHKFIPRFLAAEAGRMLVIYLSEILPFATLLESESVSSDFLWSRNGKPWVTADLTEILRNETGVNLGVQLGTADYRHIASGLDRQHVRGLMDEDDDENENLHDLQAAHSSRTADHIYGIRTDILKSLTESSIRKFNTVTTKLQVLLELTTLKRWSAEQDTSSFKRQRVIGPAETVDQQVNAAIINIFGPGARVRSEAQRQGLEAVLRNHKELIIVLPTGGGKSLLFMGPASLQSANTTVVIVPFIALTEDLIRRGSAAGITCIKWKPGCDVLAKLVIVSAEDAAATQFRHYLWDIYSKGELDRIVFDECHVLVTMSEFRSQVLSIRKISVPCPVICLTASLPPSMHRDFEEKILFTEPRYIRASTIRKNLQYTIKVCMAGDLFEKITTHVSACLEDQHRRRRVIVYSKTREQCEQIAQHLKCPYYHSSSTDKADTLDRWSSGGIGVIIATGALGVGVDVAGITDILHVGKPYGLIDFSQETGRAGRGNEKSNSTLLLTREEYDQIATTEMNTANNDDAAMIEFITTKGCRRAVMSRFLDGVEMETDCKGADAVRCDNCRRTAELESESVLSRSRVVARRETVDSKAITRMKDTLAMLKGKCPGCWALGRACEHPLNLCRESAKASCSALRRLVRYEPHSCCFRCSAPADWCIDYSNRRGACSQQDSIFPICIFAFHDPALSRCISQGAGKGFKDIQEYVAWLGKKAKVRDVNGTNAFRVFDLVLTEVDRNTKR